MTVDREQIRRKLEKAAEKFRATGEDGYGDEFDSSECDALLAENERLRDIAYEAWAAANTEGPTDRWYFDTLLNRQLEAKP